MKSKKNYTQNKHRSLKNKKIFIIGAVVSILLFVLVAPIIMNSAGANANRLNVQRSKPCLGFNALIGRCKPPKPSPSPLLSPVPTHTPSLTPTIHPQTPTLTPTPNITGNYCPTHDPISWHSVFDANRNCWYDHEHGDKPDTVDDVFGTSYFAKAGGEISYPWQTVSTMSMNNGQEMTMYENSLYPDGKHEGYKWFVRKNMLINGSCVTPFSEWCVSDVRSIVHFIGSELDANIQVHSSYTEARVCPKGLTATNTNCGIVRHGGWTNYGNFELDGTVIPNPNSNHDPANGRRIHYNQTGNKNFSTWYPTGALLAASAVQTADLWDYYNAGPALPLNGVSQCTGLASVNNFDVSENQSVYATTCSNNNSRRQLHGVFGIVPANWDGFDGSVDGRANRAGYTTRYGALTNNCTTPGTDCVPFEVSNMPVGVQFQYRDDGYEGKGLVNAAHPFNPSTPIGSEQEYDNSPTGQRKILYPN